MTGLLNRFLGLFRKQREIGCQTEHSIDLEKLILRTFESFKDKGFNEFASSFTDLPLNSLYKTASSSPSVGFCEDGSIHSVSGHIIISQDCEKTGDYDVERFRIEFVYFPTTKMVAYKVIDDMQLIDGSCECIAEHFHSWIPSVFESCAE